MLDADTRMRLEAIGKLGFTNPFGPDRPKLEAIIVGKQEARRSLWNRSLDWPREDPVLQAIQSEAERLISAARAAIARGVAYGEQDQELIRGATLYALYYRYDAPLYAWINSEAPGDPVPFYRDFEKDFHALLRDIGPPSWAATPAELIAIFFQTRRAFHFVFHQILGTSLAAAALRASVWESLFTYDPWRYLRQLRGRMHESSTLILGPSGTGKELVASAIGLSSFIPFDEQRGRFARNFRSAFHPIHLAAMSKTLIESELFGHKKGAFTGATGDRMGHLEGRSASDAIFLDEIGELDPEVQVKLLRVLQSRTFHRLGDSEPRTFQGKVIAATNRSLSDEMSAGRFREDLYYRLCSDVICTPSLEDQVGGNAEELGHLVRVLVQRTLGDSDEATFDEVMRGIEQSVGRDYAWPGNMRELEQCVRNLLIHGQYLPPRAPQKLDALDSLLQSMRSAEATLDEVVSKYSNWVYTRERSYARAGEILGVDRRTVAKHVSDS
jgi:transcriptional regulator with AAA-type ATPase domain